MLGVIEEEGAMGVGSGYNGPLYALDSLSLLDSGLPLPVHKPPTGLDKYQDIWKMNLVICFWPPLLLPRLQWTKMVCWKLADPGLVFLPQPGGNKERACG